uniref:Uncharacterized protein n=1 Tax=Avena sativa TaxID=4498 RepID=A0ACD5TSS4_AVESA
MYGRRRPRPHPQIEASEDGVRSPAVTEYLPFNDDMLREILLRLPPQPSSLLRASAVCKRWRSLVTDTKFVSLFRAHHRKPPLLGLFEASGKGMAFKSILDPPDRFPPQRFNLACHSGVRGHYLLDCRHGCLLLKAWAKEEVFVCDPMTGQRRRLVAPPEFVRGQTKGAVLCTAGDHGHVHGGCHLSSYKVVLVSSDKRPVACVYSLETGQWGNLIPTKFPCEIYDVGTTAATLVGNVLYWLFKADTNTLASDRILAFDLDRQSLAVTVGPPVTNGFFGGHRKIVKAADGAVGFAILSNYCFQMWQKNVTGQGGAIWMPLKTIEMHNILGLSRQIGEERCNIPLLGYDEDNDVIFVHASHNVYAVQLKSMQSKKLYGTNCTNPIHPFTSFYTPGTSINGGSNGAEMLHNT